MNIQTEVQKIHHQYGVSEKANYEIQKLFDKAIKEAVTEALRIHDVVGRNEQLKALLKKLLNENMCSVVGDELIEEGFKLFNDELPNFDEGIGILLEDGSKIIGQRKRHPIRKDEDCYMVNFPDKKSKMISWIYISDLLKIN